MSIIPEDGQYVPPYIVRRFLNADTLHDLLINHAQEYSYADLHILENSIHGVITAVFAKFRLQKPHRDKLRQVNT